ncbi:hypothetical protein CQA77_30350, partial [Klebsiella pneumoniae]
PLVQRGEDLAQRSVGNGLCRRGAELSLIHQNFQLDGIYPSHWFSGAKIWRSVASVMGCAEGVQSCH